MVLASVRRVLEMILKVRQCRNCCKNCETDDVKIELSRWLTSAWLDDGFVMMVSLQRLWQDIADDRILGKIKVCQRLGHATISDRSCSEVQSAD